MPYALLNKSLKNTRHSTKKEVDSKEIKQCGKNGVKDL